ncbi:MAG: PH domain-containing protein [Acidobacteriaceae bacterium]
MMKKYFPGQQDDERIVLIIRQHWIVFFSQALTWLIFIAALFGADLIIHNFLPVLTQPPYINILNLLETVILMFLALGFFMMFVMYYLNVQIITNERVVDITQKGILHHTISELNLNRIQDVTAEVKGLMETFLDYGDVYLQTAAETERFKFDHVPNPTKVAKIVLDLYEEIERKENRHGLPPVD